MRVHLLSVPNTQPTASFALDGFCTRTRLFARTLLALGHEVILYGVEQTDAPCTAFVSVFSEEKRRALIGDTPYQSVPFEPGSPLFLTFNTHVQNHIRSVKQPGDVIATIAGSAQQLIADAHPELPFWEYSVGYQGVAAQAHRVYQSHAWRHVVHGFTGVLGGRIADAVIPPWFPEDEFPVVTSPEPYVVYCGRLVPSKGLAMVCASARAAGAPLKVIGFGDESLVTYGEYLGPLTDGARNDVLAHASACLMPTQYLEPFGNVAAEAQLCGTPMVTTDFGAFVESVEQGMSGFRCRTLAEFVAAIHQAPSLDRQAIRDRAVSLYGWQAGLDGYRRYVAQFDEALGRVPTTALVAA